MRVGCSCGTVLTVEKPTTAFTCAVCGTKNFAGPWCSVPTCSAPGTPVKVPGPVTNKPVRRNLCADHAAALKAGTELEPTPLVNVMRAQAESDARDRLLKLERELRYG